MIIGRNPLRSEPQDKSCLPVAVTLASGTPLATELSVKHLHTNTVLPALFFLNFMRALVAAHYQSQNFRAWGLCRLSLCEKRYEMELHTLAALPFHHSACEGNL